MPIVEKAGSTYELINDARVKAVAGGKLSYFAPSVNFSYEFESGEEKLFLNICDDPDRLDTSKVSEKLEADILKVKAGGVESSFQMVDDRLKICRTFDTQPTTAPKYRIAQSEGIVWAYQGELTPEEIEEGCIRPDDVVGSYAIYCSNKGHIKRADGTTKVNYQTGKLCHMFAPYWVDAVGTTIKGVQTFNDNWLTFELPPKEWLDAAVYPVTLDPTVGNTSVGGTTNLTDSIGFAGYLDGTGEFYSPTSDGILDSVSAYLAVEAGAFTKTVDFGLYNISSGSPNTLLDHGAEAIDISASAWHTVQMVGGVQVLNVSNYCPAAIAGAGNGGFVYDEYAGTVTFGSSGSTLPNPNTWSVTNENYYSIYFTHIEPSEVVVIMLNHDQFNGGCI